MKKKALSYIAGGNIFGTTILEGNLVAQIKNFKYVYFIWPNSFTSKNDPGEINVNMNKVLAPCKFMSVNS